MDDFEGYLYSWAGFIDYSNCYHKVDVLWMITGICITLGTVISIIPQIVNFVKNRSSYGVNTFTLIMTSLGQFVNVWNYFALHAADFIGTASYSFTTYMPRLLSFLNLFSLWYVYLANAFLNFIFFDKKPREHRDIKAIKSNYKTNIGLSIALFAGEFVLIVMFIAFGLSQGFFEPLIRKYGYILGVSGGVIAIIQYAPQMYTTCKLQSPGSLSIILFLIQAPGGTVNALFMAIGNKDNWTTWFPIIVGAIQQFILLGICIFFILKNRKRRQLADVISEKPLISDQSNSNV